MLYAVVPKIYTLGGTLKRARATHFELDDATMRRCHHRHNKAQRTHAHIRKYVSCHQRAAASSYMRRGGGGVASAQPPPLSSTHNQTESVWR